MVCAILTAGAVVCLSCALALLKCRPLYQAVRDLGNSPERMAAYHLLWSVAYSVLALMAA